MLMGIVVQETKHNMFGQRKLKEQPGTDNPETHGVDMVTNTLLQSLYLLSNMDQAQPTGEHRIYAQTCTCTSSSFGFFSSLFLMIFPCSSIRFNQLIILQRRFFGPRYIGDDFFFRADRSLGAKQEGLTIVPFFK